MDANNIRVLMEMLGTEPTKTAGGWVQAKCPLAPWTHEKGTDSNPSFGIAVNENEESHFNCFSCGEHGGLADLAYRLKMLGAPIDMMGALQLIAYDAEGVGKKVNFSKAEDVGKPVAFRDDYLDGFVGVQHSMIAMDYLAHRNIPPIISTQGPTALLWDAGRRRVCFPIRDWDGDLMGVHGRTVDADVDPKYLVYTDNKHANPMVWHGEHWIDPDKPVIFAESVFDTYRIYQVYRNVIDPLTANLHSHKLDRISFFEDVITMFDPDLPGKKAQKAVRKVLSPNARYRNIVLDSKIGDPGDHTVGEIAEVLENYVKLDKVLV